MKILKFIIIFIAIFAAGYVLGNFIPVGSFSAQKGIMGNARLAVNLVTEKGVPVGGIEVDIGKEPGPPAKGGVAIADEKGVATFNVVPGIYYIYFNMGTFPKNFAQPDLVQVQVNEGSVNAKTIILKTK